MSDMKSMQNACKYIVIFSDKIVQVENLNCSENVLFIIPKQMI